VKKLILVSLFTLLFLLVLNACSSNDTSGNGLFQYRGSYIGDNSAVFNIITQLPHHEAFKQLSLQTKNEPYGMVLKYDDIKANNKDEVIKETVITNATYLFALVQNADWVTFDFNGQTYKVSRTKLENWYGKELKVFTNQEDLRVLIQKHIDDTSKVHQFFKR
jgi:hypothetical protein